MTDASDLGILASDVVIVVDLEDVDSFDGVADGPAAEKVLYCVDLRPTTCGITWGRARDVLRCGYRWGSYSGFRWLRSSSPSWLDPFG